MKKRIIALVLACMLLMGAGAQAVGVGAQQVNEAIGLLKETWSGVFAGMGDQTTGTMEVKNARVVRLTGSYGEDAIAAELFGEIDCILEFLLYYMTKPEYHLHVREKIYLDNMLDLF